MNTIKKLSVACVMLYSTLVQAQTSSADTNAANCAALKMGVAASRDEYVRQILPEAPPSNNPAVQRSFWDKVQNTLRDNGINIPNVGQSTNQVGQVFQQVGQAAQGGQKVYQSVATPPIARPSTNLGPYQR